MGEKQRKEAENTLKKAKKALQVTKNKLKAAFEEQGKEGRRKEITRKKAVQDLWAHSKPVLESILVEIQDY